MNRLFKNFVAAGLGVFAAVYLLNPAAGWIEFIPDIIPGVGNLDEAAAVLILLRCLSHFGIDLSFFTRMRKPQKSADPEIPRRDATRPREKVIDV